jgi:hypothetical protein
MNKILTNILNNNKKIENETCLIKIYFN